MGGPAGRWSVSLQRGRPEGTGRHQQRPQSVSLAAWQEQPASTETTGGQGRDMPGAVGVSAWGSCPSLFLSQLKYGFPPYLSLTHTPIVPRQPSSFPPRHPDTLYVFALEYLVPCVILPGLHVCLPARL